MNLRLRVRLDSFASFVSKTTQAFVLSRNTSPRIHSYVGSNRPIHFNVFGVTRCLIKLSFWAMAPHLRVVGVKRSLPFQAQDEYLLVYSSHTIYVAILSLESHTQ